MERAGDLLGQIAPWVRFEQAGPVPYDAQLVLVLVGIWLWARGARSRPHSVHLAAGATGALCLWASHPVWEAHASEPGRAAFHLGALAFGAALGMWSLLPSRRLGFAVIGFVVGASVALGPAGLFGVQAAVPLAGLAGAVGAAWTFEVWPAMWTAAAGAVVIAGALGWQTSGAVQVALAATGLAVQWMADPRVDVPPPPDAPAA